MKKEEESLNGECEMNEKGKEESLNGECEMDD